MNYFLALFLICTTVVYARIEIDIDYLKKQVQNNPQNSSYRLILAKYYMQNGKYRQAYNYVKTVLKREPENQTALHLQKKLQRLEKLQKLLPNATLTNPFSIEKHLSPLVTKNRCDTFLKIYRLIEQSQLSKTDRTDLDAAYCYAQTGKVQKAKLLLKIKDFPKNEKHYATKGLIALAQNDLTQTKRYITMLKRANPKSPYITLLEQRIAEKEKKRIRQIEQKAFAGNSIGALNDYVYLLTQQGKKEDAIRAVESYLKKYPKSIEAKILLAKLYYWNGKLDKAFHTLYPIRKTSFETKKLYANILYEKRDYTHAIYYLPSLAEKEKDPVQRYNLLKRTAFAYQKLGQEQKADAIFKKLLTYKPGDSEIRNFMQQRQNQILLQNAINAYRQKDFDEALRYYKAYFTRVADPKIAKEIAEIYFLKQKFAEAIPYFTTYLAKYPDDAIIRFHYATSLEKEKKYEQSSKIFAQVMQTAKDQKVRFLAQYHYAYDLMQLQRDKEWLMARKTLLSLQTKLNKTAPGEHKDLKRFVSTLLKTAMGPVLKPTYYKDIVLTEGSKKVLDTEAVFSDVDFFSTTKPSLKTLLHITGESRKKRPSLRFSVDYANDNQTRYRNYTLKIANLMQINGIRYSASAKRYFFDFKENKDRDGKGFFLHAGTKNMEFGLGVESFGTFNTLVPTFNWSPVLGVHSFYIDAYYRNAVFANYRACMLKNRTDLFHLGIYDKILLEDLNYAELALSLNAYEDGNTNIYGIATVPIYSTMAFGIEHTLLLNENIDFNTKTDVCYTPSRLYDSTYIKYRPKLTFDNGSLQVTLGSGYSFKNRERVSSYAIMGNYTLKDLVTFELNCEQLQSSFTTEDIHYCTFNIMQAW